LVDRSRREQPVYRLGVRGLDLDPAEEPGTQVFDRPWGQDRPAKLAPGVGQGCLDRMKAIQPLRAGLGTFHPLSPRRDWCFFRLSVGFALVRLGARVALFAEISAWASVAHGALIKKWGPG
jgi:hypothetical protein